MKHILLLGAGRSATVLIDYLLRLSSSGNYSVTIADQVVTYIEPKIKSFPAISAISFDIHNQAQRESEVAKADLVISMLPAFMHIHVAKECLAQGKHLITASYVSKEIQELHQQAKDKGLTFLMECGLDPGIDHMSAMKVIDELKEQGAKLTSFKSYTGGLIAPESDTNLWHYKITWNPRNVVLAGQGTARYIEEGKNKYIPYHQLFSRTDTIEVGDVGLFEGYANRDSLSYRQIYGLEEIPTLLRGTLRRPGYCSAWNLVVQLGLTDDSYRIENAEDLTYLEFTESFLPAGKGSVEKRLAEYMECKPRGNKMQRLKELGLFCEEKIGLQNPTPAQVIEKLMLENLKLEEGDRDMIVMQHLFGFELNEKQHLLTSSMVVTGDDPVRTAMAKTVGLPVGIAAKLLLEGKIAQTGVVIPISPEIYSPILAELKEHGLTFVEQNS